MHWGALAIFVVVYALISRKDPLFGWQRPLVTLVGALACVASGILSPAKAQGAIDGPTLLLLGGMMGVGAALEGEGLVDWLEAALVGRIQTAWGLLGVVVWGAGGLSALITNDVTCVILGPMLVRLIARLDLPPAPYLLALATAANTGSAATLVGNPQNMLCANLGALDYGAYFLRVGPLVLACLALNHGLVAWVFRGPIRAVRLPAIQRTSLPRPPWHQLRSLAVVVATLLAFLAGANLAWAALAGCLACMVLLRDQQTAIWRAINWPLLGFFAGLFVVVEGFARSGVPAVLQGALPLGNGSGGLTEWFLRSGAIVVGSNIVSNVPLILLVRPHVAGLVDPDLGWTVLAVVSTFAGNLTLVGSVANLIVAEIGRPVGGLGFVAHLRVGLPLALTTSALATWWLVR